MEREREGVREKERGGWVVVGMGGKVLVLGDVIKLECQ